MDSKEIQQEPQEPTPFHRRKRGRPKLRETVAKNAPAVEATAHEVKDEQREEVKSDKGKMMINIGKPIKDADGHVWHIKRRWVELTPVVCQVRDCGYDLLDEWRKAGHDIPEWEALTPQEQSSALREFAKHANVHRHEQSQMITVKEHDELQWPPKPAPGSRVPVR